MALAFDATAQGSTLPGDSITFSHTCTGANRILLVGVATNGDTSDVITGVTYNGVSMTRAATVVGGAGHRVYLYYLIAPATGAHDVVVSASDSAHSLRAISASYTGAAQSGQPDASNTNTANPGTSITTTVTTVADNCWTVSFLSDNAANDLVPSTGVGAERATLSNVSSLGDSNADITPAGSNSHTWTFAEQQVGSIQVSIAPSLTSDTGAAFLLNFL